MCLQTVVLTTMFKFNYSLYYNLNVNLDAPYLSILNKHLNLLAIFV